MFAPRNRYRAETSREVDRADAVRAGKHAPKSGAAWQLLAIGRATIRPKLAVSSVKASELNPISGSDIESYARPA